MTGRPTHTGQLTFTVYGDPVPQGSMRWLGARGMVAANKPQLDGWRESVRAAAHAAMPEHWQPLDGPVAVALNFAMRPPKSRPRWRHWPDSRPDLDKLIRAVLDACTSIGVWCDDAQVVRLVVAKDWADRTHLARPGVVVDILSLPLSEQARSMPASGTQSTLLP